MTERPMHPDDARDALREHAAREERLRRERPTLIDEARRAGLTKVEIAKLLGRSVSGIDLILERDR
jgi:hypothetical protein